MNEQKPARAPYRSTLRAQHAAETRRVILDAATALFVERGYAATSVDAIAEAAGVGRSTVFSAAGGKPALLKRAYDRAVAGDDEPIALADRPVARQLAAITAPVEFVTVYAEFVAGAAARVSGVYEVVRAAADSDPEVRALWEEAQQQRLAGARRIARLFSALTDAPTSRRDERRMADVITVYNDPGLHDHLVRDRGWPQRDYRDWLTRALLRELVT